MTDDRQNDRPRRNEGGKIRNDRGSRGYDRGMDGDNRKGGSRRDGPKRSFGNRDGTYGPRKGNDGRRKDMGHRPDEHRGLRSHRPREGDAVNGRRTGGRINERRPFRPDDGKSGGRGRSDGDHRGRKPFRPRDDRQKGMSGRSGYTEPNVRPKMRISSDPQKLLFRGVDLQAKGNGDAAMVMFLHGSALMSKGCENNALRLLEMTGSDGLGHLREKISEHCSEDALVEFDYLCILNGGKERSFLDSNLSERNEHAIYRAICLGEINGDDPIIDVFASRHDDEDAKIMDGLKLLKKNKDSRMADRHLLRFEDRRKRRQSIHSAFARAMNGETFAMKELTGLSDEFPEAEFFLGYVKAKESGDPVPWLRSKYSEFGETMISEEFNLRIGETPFGMFLRAKKIQSRKEDWIPSMIKAAKNGSEEALEELRPLMYRPDIKKAIANVHLINNDFDALARDFAEGLDETYYLDTFCGKVPEMVVEAGRRIGETDPMREIDWYRAHAFMEECRNAIAGRKDNERYRSRKLIYALHDVGKNIEAAELYFRMDGCPEQPAVKWLAKVCRDEDAKEYIRSHYESVGDLDTFEYIFADDGYKKRPRSRDRR